VTFSWRTLEDRTVSDWTELVNTLAKADGTEEYYQAEELREELSFAGFDPVRDSVAVWQDGRLVGYGKVLIGDNLGRDGRAAVRIEGGVHPDYRGQRIGRQIMDRLELRGRQLAAERHPGAEVWLGAFGGLPGASVQPMLEHRGFELARYFHHLELPLTGELPSGESAGDDRPELADVRPYRPELAEEVRLAHNEAFAEHWGFTPRSPQQWPELVGSRAFRPDCSFVCLAADGTVDAYVLCGQWAPGELYIELVGTRPRARGRGLARVCVAAALRAGAAEGLTTAALSVDSENGSGAGRLYESMGFTHIRVNAVYRKLVPPLAG
jgi:mycothiol synthase